MAAVKAYWFRAKRYGWGWGLPLTAVCWAKGEPPCWRWGGGDEA